VENRHSTSEPPEPKRIDQHQHTWDSLFNSFQETVIRRHSCNMGRTHSKNEYTEHSGPDQELHEVLVVPFRDTIPNPWALMVKSLNTNLTLNAVRRARWAVDHTGGTVLHSNNVATDTEVEVGSVGSVLRFWS
jgi:hypothetical protein